MTERLGASVTNLSVKDTVANQPPDFMIDPDSPPPQLPLSSQLVGTVMVYVVAGLVFPIMGAIAAKDAIAKRFSKTPQKPTEGPWPEDPRVQ